MKKNQIMQMARQAGLKEQFTTNKDAVVKKGFAMSGAFIGYKSDFDALEAFAKLVAAKEREACAKVCESLSASLEEFDALNRAAKAIRARSISRGDF